MELDKLERDYRSTLKINTLCSEVDENNLVTFPCCSSLSSKLVQILIPYVVLASDCCNNDIFQQSWNDHVCSVEITNQDDIVTKLWFPIVNSFHELLNDLENEEITLSFAKNKFGSREVTDNKLILQKLSNGLQIGQMNWTTVARQLKSCSDIETVIRKQCRGPLPWMERITRKIYEWSEVHKLAYIADCICYIFTILKVDLKECDRITLDLFTSQVCVK